MNLIERSGFFGTGPALVSRFVSRWVDTSLGRQAARSTRWGAAASIVALYLAGGSDLRGFYVMLVVVSVGVPAIVVWRLSNPDETSPSD